MVPALFVIGKSIHDFGVWANTKREEFGQDITTLVQEVAYGAIFLHVLQIAPLTSLGTNCFVFAMNSAAVIYNVIDLKKSMHLFSQLYQVQDPSEEAEQLIEDMLIIEIAKVAKAVAHLVSDVFGVLGLFFVSASFSMFTLMSLLGTWALLSGWTKYAVTANDIEGRCRRLLPSLSSP